MLNNEHNEQGPVIELNDLNFKYLEMVNGTARLINRFYEDEAIISNLKLIGKRLNANEVEEWIITLAPDDLDWEDEIRLDGRKSILFSRHFYRLRSQLKVCW